MNRSGDHAAYSWNQRRFLADRHDAGGRADHVHNIAQADARSDCIPMRIERAHGNRNPGAQPQPFRPGRCEAAGNPIGSGVTAIQPRSDITEQRVDSRQEFI